MMLTSKGDIVKVCRCLDGLHLATDVVVFCVIAKVRHSRVSRVISAKDVDSLLDTIWLVNVVDSDDSKSLVVSRISKCDARAGGNLELLNVFCGHIEINGDREQSSVSQSQVLDNTVELG